MDHPRIMLAPDVLAGKPVIRGTRLSVEFVIGLMADGWSEADILENYPGITHDDILACLRLCSRYTELGESVSERGLILRFLANENFPVAAVASLAAAGHDVAYAASRRARSPRQIPCVNLRRRAPQRLRLPATTLPLGAPGVDHSGALCSRVLQGEDLGLG